uniref:Uncharacterized protein n=1 Tax=Anguilla anguilla TaxID=7936 RepID=A0A0E9W9X3_ANGAN
MTIDLVLRFSVFRSKWTEQYRVRSFFHTCSTCSSL